MRRAAELPGEEHGRPDSTLTLGRSAAASPDRDRCADTKEKGSGMPRPSARIRFDQRCLLIAAFILASPGMILLTIAGLFDRSVALCECFIRRLSKNRRRTHR